jgi:hypothetical protein
MQPMQMNPIFQQQVMNPIFQQPMMLGGGSNTEEGTKLYISNLEYGVTNEDIQVGTLIDFIYVRDFFFFYYLFITNLNYFATLLFEISVTLFSIGCVFIASADMPFLFICYCCMEGFGQDLYI